MKKFCLPKVVILENQIIMQQVEAIPPRGMKLRTLIWDKGNSLKGRVEEVGQFFESCMAMLGITQPMSSKFPNFLSLYLSIYIIEKY
jgi:hypothetical protein